MPAESAKESSDSGPAKPPGEASKQQPSSPSSDVQALADEFYKCIQSIYKQAGGKTPVQVAFKVDKDVLYVKRAGRGRRRRRRRRNRKSRSGRRRSRSSSRGKRPGGQSISSDTTSTVTGSSASLSEEFSAKKPGSAVSTASSAGSSATTPAAPGPKVNKADSAILGKPPGLAPSTADPGAKSGGST